MESLSLIASDQHGPAGTVDATSSSGHDQSMATPDRTTWLGTRIMPEPTATAIIAAGNDAIDANTGDEVDKFPRLPVPPYATGNTDNALYASDIDSEIGGRSVVFPPQAPEHIQGELSSNGSGCVLDGTGSSKDNDNKGYDNDADATCGVAVDADSNNTSYAARKNSTDSGSESKHTKHDAQEQERDRCGDDDDYKSAGDDGDERRGQARMGSYGKEAEHKHDDDADDDEVEIRRTRVAQSVAVYNAQLAAKHSQEQVGPLSVLKFRVLGVN